MAKFKVVTPTGPTYGAKSDYALELEALRPLGAEIVEIDAKGEDDFVAAARDADALYAKGRKITTYTGALLASSATPDAGRAFLAYLARPEFRSKFAAAGLDYK